jgi:hypothetical protein
MPQGWMGINRGVSALLAAFLTAGFAGADSPNPVPAPAPSSSASAKSAPAAKAKPKSPAVPGQGNADASGSVQGTQAPVPEPSALPKPVFAGAFIAQNLLRIYLNGPASLSVYNSRGQQICHMDSRRPLEAVPLAGVSTGFIYLTVHTAQGEMTKKLVYTGK